MKTKLSNGRDFELGQELRTFERNLDEILKHVGEYVLIQGEDVIGYFPSFSAAIEEGYKRFGRRPFMVNEVSDPSRPMYYRDGTVEVLT